MSGHTIKASPCHAFSFSHIPLFYGEPRVAISQAYVFYSSWLFIIRRIREVSRRWLDAMIRPQLLTHIKDQRPSAGTSGSARRIPMETLLERGLSLDHVFRTRNMAFALICLTAARRTAMRPSTAREDVCTCDLGPRSKVADTIPLSGTARHAYSRQEGNSQSVAGAGCGIKVSFRLQQQCTSK